MWCEMLQRMRHALGLCFCEAKGTDLTPLLIAPTVLHSAPKSLKPGSNFQILMDKLDGELPKKVRSDVAKARSAFSRGRRRSNLSALAWLQGRPRGPRVWPESWSSASRMRRRLFCCYHLSCDGYNPPWTVGTQN